MNDLDEQIERLKKTIANAKRIQSELTQNIADTNRIFREIKTRIPKKNKPDKPRNNPHGK